MLLNRPDDIVLSGYKTLVCKAKQFGMKIWNTLKLNSVLDYCSVPTNKKTTTPSILHSLTSLLKT